jgi:hypothetical protein
MKIAPTPVSLIALLLTAGVVGCEKKSGDAIVLSKEHIAAAALRTTETPSAPSAASPDQTVRAMADDEITVDGYVMKQEVRGTSRDPRALSAEQWLVKVRLIADSRTFNVPADQAQFNRLKPGDRVKVKYRVGKYTNSLWSAEIE